MKNLLSKRLVLTVTVVFFTILCCFSAQAAEKKKVTYTKKIKQQIIRVSAIVCHTSHNDFPNFYTNSICNVRMIVFWGIKKAG